MNVANLLSLLLICLFPSLSMGFWLDTHQKITDIAIGVANLNSTIDEQTGFTSTLEMPVTVGSQIKPLKEWIWFGSRQEDEPFSELRFLNHFYNPLNDSGLYGTFLSSYKWADDSRNEWRWYVARSAFYRALTAWPENDRKVALATAFRAIGQVTHLTQDTAVPAHTRNDGHNPDGFEQYVDTHLNTVVSQRC